MQALQLGLSTLDLFPSISLTTCESLRTIMVKCSAHTLASPEFDAILQFCGKRLHLKGSLLLFYYFF
jgi:hypothetical protein